MSKPRPLDYAELQRMRDRGMTWKAIADELHWSAASLRDRLNRDGWYEAAPQPVPAMPAPSEKKKGSLKEQVYAWLKAGIEPETAATALGKTLPALAMCCRCDLGELKAKARADAAVEIALATYERALAGDRAALSQYKRSLA